MGLLTNCSRVVTGRSRTAWAGVWLWMTVTAVASLSPGYATLDGFDSVFHAFGYAVLTWLIFRALGLPQTFQRVAFSAAIAWGFGALLEGLQAFHPDRTAEVRDLIANAYGVAGGAVLSLILQRRVHPQES